MARSFNGSSDQISVAGLSSFIFNTAGTYSWTGWLYPTTLDGAYRVIWAKDTSGNRQFNFTASGGFNSTVNSFAWFTGGGSGVASTTSAMTTNTWYFFCATYANGTINLYVFDPSGSMAVNYNPSQSQVFSTDAGTSPCLIGFSGAPGNSYWAGRLADLVAWNGIALTQGEATALRAGIRPSRIRGGPTTKTAWLPLDGLSSPEPDLSGNKNNGTLTGTASAFGPPVTMFTPRRPQKIEVAGAAPGVGPFIFTPAIVP